jgi:succinate-semialdehyde dehydrogenase / glutarate-semialdehyde dehydrogenase
VSAAGVTAAATFAVVDPATGAELEQVADATPADALAALDSAVAAFNGWRATAPRVRAEVLRRAYELMVAREDELAALMTAEMGKPLAEARGEVRYAAAYVRWYAEEAVRIGGRTARHEDDGSELLTVQEPVGPCLLITPWNFPLAMGARKVAPALAAGCVALVKPAEQTPLSMLALAEIFAEAGLPDGVLHVLPTTAPAALTTALLDDGRLRKLSFTGSTAVGRVLAAQAAGRLLRVSMELGGNAPFLVFADADLDAAVQGALAAKVRNMGQACTAANRFLVEQSVAAAFTDRLAAAMGALRVGPGAEPGSEVGPLIDARAREGVQELVDDAVARGARVRAGGRRVGDAGFFYAPTVLDDVAPGSRILAEEVFGPVAPVIAFGSYDEAVRLANDTTYGLAAYAYTNDNGRALDLVRDLQFGMVGINRGVVSYAGAPFGGIKDSGFGREGGPEGLQEYLSTKYAAFGRA